MERAIIILRENTLQNHAPTPNQHENPTIAIGHHIPSWTTQNCQHSEETLTHTSCIRQTIRDAVPDPPMVAFRRPKNLRDLLVRVELKNSGPPSTQTGNYQCQDKRFHTCKIIIEKNTFTSKINGRKHNVCTIHSHVKPEILSI